MRKTFLLSLSLVLTWGAMASTVDDLVAIDNDWTFIADDITNAGTVDLSANTLYCEGKLFSPTGNTKAANKGDCTFSGGTHLNSVRLKNDQNRLSFKVADACEVTFYGQSWSGKIEGTKDYRRGILVSSVDGVKDTLDTHIVGRQPYLEPSFTVALPQAGTYYLTSFGGDIFFAGFEVKYPSTTTEKCLVTFANNTDAIGAVPVVDSVLIGKPVTIPVNKTLYKAGYTLSGWSDGTKTYAIGSSYTTSGDVTMNPVFTENVYSVADVSSTTTVHWDFQKQNGAPEVQWENRTNDVLVEQAVINGQTTDIGLIVNTNPGKFNNAAWNDWCQVNENTTFTFPTIAEAVVSAYSMYEPKNGTEEKSTVDGNAYSAYSGYVATYNVATSTGSSVLTIKGGSYYRYIEVTYPATIPPYIPEAGDESINIKMNEGNVADNVWTNGVYTLTTSGIGSSGGADFKFDAATDAPYTIAVPADVVVKQFIIKNFHANYSGGNGKLKTVSSEGAITYLPSKTNCVCNVVGSPDANRQYEGEAYDLVINIKNHIAGKPIVFTMVKSAQPMGWIQLTIAKQAPTTPPSKITENVTISDNDAAILVSFDREIAGDVKATIGTQQVTAKGGGSSLLFNAWDLNYETNYTLTIAAGAVKDTYGNVTDAAIEVAVNMPAKAAVAKAVYDYVVSDVTELNAALDAVEQSNPKNNKTAARKTIFIKNGDYNLGEVKDGDNYLTVRWLNANNVSLIGESRDGVIIRGTSSGISNPVLNLRYGQGFYLQDLTVKNDFDYGTGEFKGVAVAIYGGDKTIMKNVRMLSNQDTQVTGDRVYHEDCEIHGTVDFICGGGDNYYYHTELVLENRGGNVIVAPSTGASTQWGYVFDHCKVKAVDAEAATTNSYSYHLGRPWQNEPRATFLYTDMQVLCKAEGWTNMSAPLVSHFYEYGTEHEGTPIDLSNRKKPSSSPNDYIPVLTADSAATFTVRNVLGGNDAWDAAAQAAQMSAPANIALSATTLSWDAVEEASLYVVFKDGKYFANVTTNSYTVSEKGAYTVKAANRYGGLGAESNAVTAEEGASSEDQPCKVHTIGDSTMQDYDEAVTEVRGWATYLGAFFDSEMVTVNNRGKAGASSRTFYKDPSFWASVKQQMSAGDYLLIQFAHNDENNNGLDVDEYNEYLKAQGQAELTDLRGTCPNTTYKEFLRKYVDEAREMGVKPVFVGPICRKYFKTATTLKRAGLHDLGDNFSKLEGGVLYEKQKVGEDCTLCTDNILDSGCILVQKGKKNYYLINVD